MLCPANPMLMAANAGLPKFLAGYRPTSTADPVTFNKPGDAAVGDLLVTLLSSAGTNTWTMPSGWTQGTPNAAAVLAYHEVAAGDPASWSFTSSPFGRNGHLFHFRNAVWFAGGTVATASAGNTELLAPSMVAAAGLLLGVWAGNNGFSWTTPSDMTAMGSNTSDPCYAAFYQRVAAGATGTRGSTPSTSSTGNRRALLASLKGK